MVSVKIIDGDKTKYMDLLLIADESVSMIEKYLYRGDMFALYDEGVSSIAYAPFAPRYSHGFTCIFLPKVMDL